MDDIEIDEELLPLLPKRYFPIEILARYASKQGQSRDPVALLPYVELLSRDIKTRITKMSETRRPRLLNEAKTLNHARLGKSRSSVTVSFTGNLYTYKLFSLHVEYD